MSNLKSLTKAQLIDRIEQLERNAEDDRRRIGVMMYEANQLTQRIVELEAEVERLDDELITAKELVDEAADDSDKLYDARQIIETQAERIKLLSRKVAAQPQRQVSASKPLPSPVVVESTPTIEVSDFDRAMWSKFQALPRETRLEIIDFARPEWGHVGIHNIAEIRAAWRAAKPISA